MSVKIYAIANQKGGEGRPSVSEVSEGIRIYKEEAKPEVTPLSKLPQESKIKSSL